MELTGKKCTHKKEKVNVYGDLWDICHKCKRAYYEGIHKNIHNKNCDKALEILEIYELDIDLEECKDCE